MRSAVWIVLATSAGCGSPGATQPPPVLVAPMPVVTAPQASAVVPTSTASVPPPPPPPPPIGVCAEGAPVDMAKVYDKLEGSFTRAGVHEMLATLSCKFNGEDMDAHILAVRDAGDVFKISRLWVEDASLHESIDHCQALPTSEGRDLVICQSGSVSYGQVFSLFVESRAR